MPALRLSSGAWKSTGSPSTVMRPSSGRCTPVRHLISVDLPAPLSPTMAVISPVRARDRRAAQGGHAAEALDDALEHEGVLSCRCGGHLWYLMRTAEATTTVPTAMGW